MKKLLTFLTLLTLFFMTAGAEEKTITLSWAGNGTQNDGSTLTAAQVFTETANYTGTANAATCATANTVYIAKQQYGLKIGKSGGSGNLIIGITPQVMPSKVVFSVAAYSASTATTVKVKLNGVNEYTLLNASKEQQLQNVTVEMDGMTQLTNINITATKYSHLKSITIYYEDGGTPVTPRVETPVITLSKDAPYYVGDNVTASITCGTEGAAIQYQINGGAWTNYTAGSNITIPTTTAGTVTIKAKATKADYNDSNEATKTITISPAPTTYNHLADVNSDECTTGTEFTFTAQTVVLGKYNKQLYIVMPDNSAGSLIFADSNWGDGYTFGKVVSSNWSGTKAIFNDKPEVTNPSDFSLEGTETEVTPIEISTDADLQKSNFGRYAVIKNVQVDENGSFSGLTTYNQFHPDLSNFEAGRYDVYGVIGWNKGNNDSEGKGQFMPLRYEEHIAAYTITVTQPTAGGTISADAETADEGEEITLTATPAAGYEFASWIVKDADNNDIAVTENKFNMPASNVTVTATFSKIWYTITCVNTPTEAANAYNAVWLKAGFDNTNGDRSQVGNLVRFKVHTVNGWQIDNVTAVYGENSTAITLSEDGTDNLGEYGNEGSSASDQYGTWYSFTMPAGAVTITGTFRPYQPTIRLAGRFNGRPSTYWETGNNGPAFNYDSETEKYTMDVFFTGAVENENEMIDYFWFRSDNEDLKTSASGDYWLTDGENGNIYQAEGHNLGIGNGYNSNFRIKPGIYTFTINKDRTKLFITKKDVAFTFTPATGTTVEQNSTVTATSDMQTILNGIKNTYDNGAEIGTITTQVSTDNSTWGESATMSVIGTNQPVYAKSTLDNLIVTDQATYTVEAVNNSNQYQLVTDITKMVSGKKYLLVSKGTYKASGVTYNYEAAATTINSANNYLGATDVTIEDNIITLQEGTSVVPYIMSLSDGKWTFKNSITNEFLTFANPSSGGGTVGIDATSGTGLTLTSIDSSTGEAVLTLVEGRTLQFNPNNAGTDPSKYRFGTYTSIQKPVMLFKQLEEVVTLKVETPVITPGTGTYAEAKDVEITCSTPGATIWYKYGNMTDYAEYTEALTISENTTLSAYATKDGYNDSDVATATYKFSELSDEIFTLVTSEDQLIEGNEYIIVAATDTYKPALGAIESRNGTPANGYTFETAGDYSVLTLAAESDVNIFTLGKVEVTDPNDKFYWTFKDKDGNFLYADVSGGAIDTDNQSNYSHVYKINIGEGTHYNNYATIQGSANYQIEYRTDDEIFRHYACSNVNQTGNVYKKVLLYTRGVQQTPIMTLADICKYGVTTEGKNEYIIADKLQAVYAYTKGGNSLLWCKDLGNKSIVPTTIHSGQIDFMREPGINTDTEGVHNGQQGLWDQSNWIVLQFTNPTGPNNIDQMLQAAQDKFIKPGTIKGKLVDDENYILKMDLDQLDLVTQADPDYDDEPYNENVYCPANFLPENLNIHDGIENGDGAQIGNVNYFFMNPKVQEICYITYAQWDDYGYFAVPSSSDFSSGIDGAFQVGWVYQEKPALVSGKIYKFHAVVHRVGKEYGPQNPVSTKDGMPVYENITVLPIDLTGDDNIVTSINTVDVAGNGEVKSVKYVNVAGMVSDVPFQGVNIVVTEYSDGSRSTSKMLRK